MLLLIDIGNSRTTIGSYDNGIKRVSGFRTIPGGRDEEEYRLLFRDFVGDHMVSAIQGVVICSVVPEVTPVIARSLKKNEKVKPLIVTHRLKTGLVLKVKHTEKIGADRIATAVGARHLYGGDLIIIDFGTATTFCIVSSEGEYRSGAIMPGIGISADSLAEKTSLLSRIDPVPPHHVMGEDTEENISAGLILGHAGGVERLISEIIKETGTGARVVATGGYAALVAPYIKNIRYINPLLTLEGLSIIYGLNQI
jgi:type III pantothenate kinase